MDEKKNFRWVPLAIAICFAGLLTFFLSCSPVTAFLLRIRAPQLVFAVNNVFYRPVYALMNEGPDWIGAPLRTYNEWWLPEPDVPICVLPPPIESAPSFPEPVEHVEQAPTLTNPID